MTIKLRTVKLLLLFCLLAAPLAAAASLPEPQIKAVVLHSLGKYVIWPEETFRGPLAPIVIGILGDDPFGEVFDPLLRKTVQNRPVQLLHLKGVDQARGCHVVFISREGQPSLNATLQYLKGSNVLTVSDMEDFAGKGGMIQLFVQDKRIRFNINLKSAEAAGLRISSSMLKLANTVLE